MADWDDVRRLALAMPETTEREGGHDSTRQWRIRDRLIVWERPLRRADLEVLGDAAPDGPVLAARVGDEGDKQALLQQDPDVFFTTPHFDGYPAVLVRLELIEVDALEELVVDAWLDRAPKRLAAAWLAEHRPTGDETGAPGPG